MAIVYGLIGLAIAYFGLRNSRSVGRHILVLAAAMLVVGFLAAVGFQIFYPLSGDRVALDHRNAQMSVQFVAGTVAAIVGPIVGAVLASVGRKARLGLTTFLIFGVLLLVADLALATAPVLADDNPAKPKLNNNNGETYWSYPVILNCPKGKDGILELVTMLEASASTRAKTGANFIASRVQVAYRDEKPVHLITSVAKYQDDWKFDYVVSNTIDLTNPTTKDSAREFGEAVVRVQERYGRAGCPVPALDFAEQLKTNIEFVKSHAH